MTTPAEHAATVREALGIREWAASITPSKYGEKAEREMPDAFAALDALQAQAEQWRDALERTNESFLATESEHAATVREALFKYVHVGGNPSYNEALAALGEVVAERDRLRNERDMWQTEAGVRIKRVTELEAALTNLRDRANLHGVWWLENECRAALDKEKA